MNNLGERLGVDLSSAAEGLGLDVGKFTSPRSQDSDFEPRTDIFDTSSQHIIHVSLPGAKKSDVGVEWDGDHSILRVTGVVHRPGVDEETLAHLAVDGRKRETGVFEKNIRLGTQKEPANIDVGSITAKMVDGVLVINVPKIEKKRFQKKEVRIDGSPSGEFGVEQQHDIYMDDHNQCTADDNGPDQELEMYETEHDTTPYPAKASSSSSSKEKEAEHDQFRDTRSETLGFEQPNATEDTLPRYEPEDSSDHGNQQQETHAYAHPQVADEEEMSDWEKAGSDGEGEGEYVKINVD